MATIFDPALMIYLLNGMAWFTVVKICNHNLSIIIRVFGIMGKNFMKFK